MTPSERHRKEAETKKHQCKLFESRGLIGCECGIMMTLDQALAAAEERGIRRALEAIDELMRKHGKTIDGFGLTRHYPAIKEALTNLLPDSRDNGK